MSQLSLRTLFIIVGIVAAILFIVRTNTKEGFDKLKNKPSCPNLLVQKGTKVYLYNTRLSEVPGVNPIVFDNLEEYTEFIDWQRSQGIRCPVLYLQEVQDASGKTVCRARPCISEPQGGLPPTNATLTANATSFSEIPDIKGTNNVAGGLQKVGDIPDIKGTTNVSGGLDNTSNGSRNITHVGETPLETQIPGSKEEIEEEIAALRAAAPYADPSAAYFALNPNNRYPNLKRTKLIDSGNNDPPWNIGGYPAYDSSNFYQGVHTPLDEMNVINQAKPASSNAMDPNWGGKEYTKKLVENDYYDENEVYLYER